MLRYACSLFGGGSDNADAGGTVPGQPHRQPRAVRTALARATKMLKRQIRSTQRSSTESLAEWLADYLETTRDGDDAPPTEEYEPDAFTPPPFSFEHLLLPKRHASLVSSPSAALFCDGTSNYFTEPTPTNIPILYSLVQNCFPSAMRDRCLYFRGVGRDGMDFVVAYSVVAKLKEIYWATCRALRAVPDGVGSPPLVLDIFGFSRGALLARAVSYLFLRYGAVSVADAEADADAERQFRARCDGVVDAFMACGPLEKLRFGQCIPSAGRRPCVIRFLGLFDTVPGMSLERASELGALIPRRFLDGEDHAAIWSSMHLQAGNPTALFPNLSLYEPNKPNFTLDRAPVIESTRATTAPLQTVIPPGHYEYRVPGDHCNIGGGWDSLADRMTKRSISNATLRTMLAASPYRNAALGPKLFPAPRSNDEWAADIRDSLACRSDLVARQPIPRAEALQLVARNLAEIHGLPLRDDPPLTDTEIAAAKKRLKKNIADLLAISE